MMQLGSFTYCEVTSGESVWGPIYKSAVTAAGQGEGEQDDAQKTKDRAIPTELLSRKARERREAGEAVDDTELKKFEASLNAADTERFRVMKVDSLLPKLQKIMKKT